MYTANFGYSLRKAAFSVESQKLLFSASRYRSHREKKKAEMESFMFLIQLKQYHFPKVPLNFGTHHKLE